MSNKNKKIRRLERHQRNKKKEEDYKKEAWESGKLIEPNHNNKGYPVEYSLELGKRLLEKPFLIFRQKIRDYLLLCPLEARNETWNELKKRYDEWLDRE